MERAGFTLLDPATTGITFTNYLSDTKAAENQIRLSGSGVALGDIDGDGWCGNELVQMKSSGTPAVIHLEGTQTVRFTMASGDYDYFLLVPSSAQPKPKFTGITRNATTGEITVEWTGGGTLEAAASLAGPWQPVTSTSPYKFTPNPALPVLFGRIKR